MVGCQPRDLMVSASSRLAGEARGLVSGFRQSPTGLASIR